MIVRALLPSTRSKSALLSPIAGAGRVDGLKTSGGTDVSVTALSSRTLTVTVIGVPATNEPDAGDSTVTTGGVVSNTGAPVRTRSTAACQMIASVISLQFAFAVVSPPTKYEETSNPSHSRPCVAGSSPARIVPLKRYRSL